jgi:hypothetical protein
VEIKLMPKPLPRRLRREPESGPFGLRRWLITGQRNRWFYLDRVDEPAEVWSLHGPDVVEHYIKKFPGRRPILWWRFSASEPRRRLGGTGQTLASGTNVEAEFEFGVPKHWLTAADLRYHHHLVHAVPWSEDDPPKYEAEATYLVRHGLLLPGEEERLTARDFEPDIIRLHGDRIALLRHDHPARTRPRLQSA